MASKKDSPLSGLIVGAALLTVGILFWLDRSGRIDASEYLDYWPLLLVAMGLAELASRRVVSALVWMLIGVAFLRPGGWWDSLQLVLSLWPLLITAAGATLIAQAVRSSRNPSAFRASAVMAGNTRSAASDGSAVAVMGGCMIDYGIARNVAGDLHLDVLAFWGGVEVRVPAGWQVVDRVTPILGGSEDKTVAARDNAPRLIVRGSAIMGGVEIKSLPESPA